MSLLVGSVTGVGFFSILCVFGFLVSTRFLRMRSLPAILGGTAIFGPALYLVLINALGYALPIQWAFLSGMFLLAAASIFLSVRIYRDGKFFIGDAPESPSHSTLFLLILAGLLGGLATARFLTSDPWVWSYLPLASTIKAGNFPVLEPANPWSLAGYHYGPQLFAAAFSSLTGNSVAAGFNVQPFFGAIGGLCFCAALVRAVTGSWRGSLLGSILAFAGAGCVWLYGFFLLGDLFDAYVLGEAIVVPFKWLAPTFSNTVNPSLFVLFGSRTYTFGFPLLFGMLYCVHHAFHLSAGRETGRWILACIVLSLALALTAETILVLMLPAALVYVAVLRWGMKQSDNDAGMPITRIAAIACAIFIPSIVIALVQGGILTTSLLGNTHTTDSMFLHVDGKIRITSPGETLALWEPRFWMVTGWPMILLPLVVWYWWRRRLQFPFILFVGILMLGHLTIPFFVRFLREENQFLRLLHIGFSLSGFLIGVLLAQTWLISRSRMRRVLGALIVGSMLLSSAIYLVTRLALPNMRYEPDAPFFAPMPSITVQQEQLYEWVRTHTTLDDYFYIRTVKGHPNYLPEMVALQPDRIRFMAYTGRFSVGFLMWGSYEPGVMEAGEAIEERCDPEAFRTLRVRYLVIESEERARWFATSCDPRQWIVRYQEDASLSAYPRIYERGL